MKQNRAVRSDAWDGGLFPAGTSSVYSQPHLALIRELAEPVRLFAGDYLYQENDPADRLYFVNRGSLKVSKPLEDGSSATLSLHIPGDLFGEPDPFGRAVHQFESKALEDSEVGIVPQAELDKVIRPTVTLPWSIWAGWHSCGAPRKANYATSLAHGKSGACALCSCGCTICTGRAGQTRKLERSSASGLRIWKWRR